MKVTLEAGNPLIHLDPDRINRLRAIAGEKGIQEDALLANHASGTAAKTLEDAIAPDVYAEIMKRLGIGDDKIATQMQTVNALISEHTPPAESAPGAESATPSNETDEQDDEDEEQDDDKAVDQIHAPAPEPVEVAGIMRGLAQTLRAKDSLQIVISKREDESLVVTLIPAAIEKQPEGTNTPIQIIGSAEEIDANFLTAIKQYVPTRELVIKTVEEIATNVATAAARAKESSKKKPTLPSTPPKPKTGLLKIEVTPKDAKLTITDDKGKEHAVAPNRSAALPHGAYTVLATKDGYEEHKQTATVTNTTANIKIALKEAQPSLL